MAKKKESALSKAKARIEQLENKVTSLEAKVQEADEAKRALREWLGITEVDTEEIEDRISSLEDDIEDKVERAVENMDDSTIRNVVEDVLSGASISV